MSKLTKAVEPDVENVISDRTLVRWLRKQGCSKNIPYNFVLEKGMGEMLTIEIVSKTDVEVCWYNRDAFDVRGYTEIFK